MDSGLAFHDPIYVWPIDSHRKELITLCNSEVPLSLCYLAGPALPLEVVLEHVGNILDKERRLGTTHARPHLNADIIALVIQFRLNQLVQTLFLEAQQLTLHSFVLVF